MESTKTASKKLVCTECKNELDLSATPYQVGDMYECSFCGIEYEVVEITPEGEYSLRIIEEEK